MLGSEGASQIPAGAEQDSDLDVLPSKPNGQESGAASASGAEEQLLDRLVDRLGKMGVIPGTSSGTTPKKGQWGNFDLGDESTWDADYKPWGKWSQWSAEPGKPSGWSSWDYSKKSDWGSDDKFERPYISHLDFPKFDGRKEEFSNYQYSVLNLKSQCGPKDYKYLAPKLIANFTGAMSEDARAMELLGSDFLEEDGVEKLLTFIRKRLHITDLHLETDAFDK